MFAVEIKANSCETAAHCFSTYEIIMEKMGRGKNGAGGQKETTKRAITQIQVLEAKSNLILIFHLFEINFC